MSGERSSTVRQIRGGKVCALCRATLPPPHSLGEQLCDRCRRERGRHRVYLSFMFREGWHCQFLEADLKTSLPKKLTLRTEEKVRELARRGGAVLTLETLQALDHALEIGRGGIWLELSAEQYGKLLTR